LPLDVHSAGTSIASLRSNGRVMFDPPIKLQRNIVVLTLDDAVAFMRSYKHAKLPMARDAVLHRLESARAGHERQIAGNAFRTWAHAEGLVIDIA
jgi:hypothetical protein